MLSGFAEVALSEAVTRIERPVEPKGGTSNRQLGVRLWGEGAYERERLDGGGTKYAVLFRVEGGDIVVNKIWARNGSVAVVPSELAGCLVSGEFPTFCARPDRLDSRWFHWITKARWFWSRCAEVSQGTSGKNRLRPDQFLSVTIPLPTLAEQRRILQVLEGVHAKLSAAQALRRDSCSALEQMLRAKEFLIWPTAHAFPVRPLADVTTHLARGRQSKQGGSSHFLIKTQHVQLGRYLPTSLTLAPEIAARVGADSLVRPADILIACSAAGCLGRVARFPDLPIEASTDTHVAIARPDTRVVTPDYLYAYLRGAQGQVQLRSREKGDWQREKVGFRLTELNVADLRRVPVPVPPLREQARIVAHLDALRAKVGDLKAIQSQTAAELDALLPSVLGKAFRGEL